MYRFPHIECQEKNGVFQKEIFALWMLARRSREQTTSQKMEMMRESKHHSGENIVPRMRNHSRAKTVAHNRKTAEERAKCGDRDHSRCAFVRMRESEGER